MSQPWGFLSPAQQWETWGCFFLTTVWHVERSIQSLLLSARPPESSIQSGRRSLTQGGREIPSLCTPEGKGVMSENPMNTETRGETPVWIMYFSGSDGSSAEVITDSCFSGAKTRTADLPLLNSASGQKSKTLPLKSLTLYSCAFLLYI